MTEIISRDTIKAQARRAAEADLAAGRTTPDCPYEKGTLFAKKWLAAYWTRECELHDKLIVGTFADGPVEQMEVLQG